MVLASIWEHRIHRRAFEQGFEQGRQEGLAEIQRLWMAWYRRLQDAEERGVPFTEPHPTLESVNTA